MTTYIIAALLLALLQTWLIPASFNMKIFLGWARIEMSLCLMS
jgi:hypothetical protein